MVLDGTVPPKKEKNEKNISDKTQDQVKSVRQAHKTERRWNYLGPREIEEDNRKAAHSLQLLYCNITAVFPCTR